MLFLVKVRVDINKLEEFGRKLQNGDLGTSSVISTYCIKDDPSIGLAIWETNSKEEFEKKFALHREYYGEIIEIVPVITSKEAQKILMEQIRKNKTGN